MIPTAEKLGTIARMGEGSFEEIPFALLLLALAAEKRDATVEIQRRAVRKEVVTQAGVPVQCSSNLAHETLGRYLISTGKLTQEEETKYFSEAVSRGILLGKVLVEREVLKPEELERVLQHSLARRLLDGFTWREGTFRIRAHASPVLGAMPVNVAQLILLGVSRFAPVEMVSRTTAALIGKKLVRHPSPPLAGGEPCPTQGQRKVLESLTKPLRIDELMVCSGLTADDVARAVVSLMMAGLAVLADSAAAFAAARPAEPALAAKPVPTPPPSIAEAEHERALAAEIETIFLAHQRLDPFEMLGVTENASPLEVGQAFVAMTQRWAPWQRTGETAGRATALLLAGARAYAALADPESRTRVLARRHTQPTVPVARPSSDADRIRTDLLDPAVQFAKGKKLMDEGRYKEAIVQIEYASDLDPQNPSYRAELAYCRFLHNPDWSAQQALDELEEVLRMERGYGLALFYIGEVHRGLGHTEQAKIYLEKAIKPMAGDRRPIEALRALGSGKG
jgi:tetratricopeptide (TPR) repeat protein